MRRTLIAIPEVYCLGGFAVILSLALLVYVWRLREAIAAETEKQELAAREQEQLRNRIGSLERQVAALQHAGAPSVPSPAQAPSARVEAVPAIAPFVVRQVSPAERSVADMPISTAVPEDATLVEPRPRPRQPMPPVGILPPLETVPVATPPPVPRQSLEHRVGTNWLNRIGTTLLVFGVAFFLAYQLTHIGPLGKALSGLAVAGVLLAGGLWLEPKPQYRVFARAGIGGGWALFFFSTFAMHYIPATYVIQSEFADLLLLFFVGAGMVAHSLRYRSQVVTSLAFLLAFSTVTISHQTLYSLLASAVLAIGLEVVCSLEGWYVLEIAGIVAAYGNHFLWLSRTVHEQLGPGHPFAEYWPSTLVLLLFFVVFRMGYVLRKPADQHAEALSSAAAVLNAGIVLAEMKYQSFHPQWAFLALLGFGALEFCFAFFVRWRDRRTAFAVLTTIASVLVMAAVPFRYGGATWAALWLAEGEVLWLAGYFTRERAMRLLGSLAIFATLLKLVVIDVVARGDVHTMPHRWLLVSILLACAACLWANAEVLSGRLELHVPTAEGDEQYLASAAAAGALLFAGWVATDDWTTAILWSLCAVLLFAAGLWRRSLRLRLEAYGALLAALVRLLLVDFAGDASLLHGVDRRMLTAGCVMAACIGVAEWQRYAGRQAAVLVGNEAGWVGGALTSGAGVVLSSLLYLELPGQWLAAGWAGLALLQAAGALRRDGIRPRVQVVLLSALVLARGLAVNLTADSTRGWQRWPLWCAIALLFATVPIGFRLRKRMLDGTWGRALVLRHPEQVPFFMPLALVIACVIDRFSGGTLTIVISSLGVVVFLVALAVEERSFRLAGLGLLLAGVLKLLLWDVWQMAPAERYLSLIAVGVALLLVSFLYSRFAERLKNYL